MLSINRREICEQLPVKRARFRGARAAPASAGRGLCFIVVLLVTLFGVTGCATLGKDSPDGAVRPAGNRPIAIRGGVLMMPVTAGTNAGAWPKRITLRTEDGRAVPGRIVWIEPNRETGVRHWTDPARAWTVRAVGESDPLSGSALRQASGRAVLLAALPERVSGPLQLGDQIIEPHWFDAPKPLADRGDSAESAPPPGAVLRPERRPDRPAPDNPFAYWRWTLLADDMGFTPHDPVRYAGESEFGQLIARHQADLWRLALNRLAEIDLDRAHQCRSLLTQRCKDPTLPIGVATWITEPAALSALLSRLLDFNAGDQRVLDAVSDWIDEHAGVLAWPHSDEGDRVWMALANPSVEPVTAAFQWTDTPAHRTHDRTANENIREVELAPLKVNRIAVPRPDEDADERVSPPQRMAPSGANANRRYLRIDLPHRQVTLPFGPRYSAARPPGTFFRALTSTLTLADLRADQAQQVDEARQTIMHVRKAGSQWEVFAECRRPAEAPHETSPSTAKNDAQASTNTHDYGRWYDALRGRETFVLMLGPRPDETSEPAVALIVPEHGEWELLDGSAPNDLEVHRRSYRDRWLVRLVLPESWLDGRYGASSQSHSSSTSPKDGESIDAHSLLIGCLRTHGDRVALETGPSAALPWQADAVRRLISLRYWDE